MTLPPLFAPSSPPRLFFWSLSSFFLLLLWDYSGLDLAMAHWFGSASGFALESHWLWRNVLHDDIRLWPWVFELGLLIAIFLPVGTLRQLPMARRTQLALTTLAALLNLDHQAVQPYQLPLGFAAIRRRGDLRVALGLGAA